MKGSESEKKREKERERERERQSEKRKREIKREQETDEWVQCHWLNTCTVDTQQYLAHENVNEQPTAFLFIITAYI